MTGLSLPAQLVLFSGDIWPDGRLSFSEKLTEAAKLEIARELLAAGYAEAITTDPDHGAWQTDPERGPLALRLTEAGRAAHAAIDLCDLAIAEESAAHHRRRGT